MQFRLKSLLIFAAFSAILIAGFASRRTAIKKARQIESDVDSILDDMYLDFRKSLMAEFESAAEANPTYAAFKSSNLPQSIGYIYTGGDLAYRDAGNSRGTSLGGLIDGPTSLSRNVVMSMTNPTTDFSAWPIQDTQTKVDIEIEHYVPWRFFAGRPKTIIRNHGAPKNKMFMGILKSRLDESGIEYEMSR